MFIGGHAVRWTTAESFSRCRSARATFSRRHRQYLPSRARSLCVHTLSAHNLLFCYSILTNFDSMMTSFHCFFTVFYCFLLFFTLFYSFLLFFTPFHPISIHFTPGCVCERSTFCVFFFFLQDEGEHVSGFVGVPGPGQEGR